MITGEEIKKYFWYLFGMIGVVFFWAGVWDGLGNIHPIIANPWLSLALGIILLGLSGIIFKDANILWEREKPVMSEAKKVHNHPNKEEFHFKYQDHLKN